AMSRRRLGGLAASGAVLGTGALLTAPSPGAEARERDQLANPGFAEGLSRWRLSGQSSSAQVRAAGGRPHLPHPAPAAAQEAAVSCALLGTGALLPAPSPGAEARERDQLANPGFAEGLSRWRLSGQSSSAQVRAAGGRPHVLHLEPAAGQEVAVSQRVVVGRGGERTLRALVRAGGDGRAASLELRSRNRTDRVHVPVTGAEGAWLELAVSAPAARGILDI